MSRASYLRAMLVVLTAAAASGGCNGSQASVDPGYQGAAACPPSGAAVTPALTDPVPQVTFYGDLLPVLQSQQYGCTTCHTKYLDPAGINTLSEVNLAITDMTSGKMPSEGSRVPPAQIQLFRTWQLQGFQPGDPNAKVKPIVAASASAATSGGCSAGKATPSTSPAVQPQ